MAIRMGRTSGPESTQRTFPIPFLGGNPSPEDGRTALPVRHWRRKISSFFLLLIVGFAFVHTAFAAQLPPVEAVSLEHRRDLGMTFFVTAMLFLLVWAIFNYLQERHPEVGLFAVHQAVYTLFGLASTGYLAHFFGAGHSLFAEWTAALLTLAINVTTLLFCREWFKLYEPPKLLVRGLMVLLGASAVLMAIFALGFHAVAFFGNAALIEITWLALAVTAIAFHEEDYPRRWILQAFFVVACLSNAAFWLASRNGRTTSPFTLSELHMLLANGLVASGFFVIMLKARALHTQRTAQQSFLDLLRVQKKFEIEKELKKQAEVQAQTDFLTGVFNRRCFVESAEAELERAIQSQRPLSLLMFDIDHFKSINDTWGHAMGDIVLQQVSHLIRDALRTGDIFGRTGGEEFAAVLVRTEGDSAFNVSQRLCGMVADAIIIPEGAERIPVTISIGLAQLKGRNISFDELMNEADQAMYAAKKAGRNRVAVSA